MSKNLLSDKPISSEIQDRFQRYNFAKRVAQSIIQRESQEGIVIGIYGAWGEGKTSVLNFIESELRSSEDILIINFNPWRYGNEDDLIKNFLTKISEALGKQLEKRTEKIGSFLKKYGSLTSFWGIDLSNLGQSLERMDLEILKNRVNTFLNETTSKLVIFVDDIDRLDKQEIFSLFRLIKLTADFNNTTYILSFDEIMVAAALGERFGDATQSSGQNFLEKIVQVPLKIPHAQLSALRTYCYELIDKALNENKIKLSTRDGERYIYQFSQNILLKLKTPRLAVRYANSISFSLPLLEREVNYVDLLLIEAIKIFYPEYYEFAKKNPRYFISENSLSTLFEQSLEDRKKELDSNLEQLAPSLSVTEKRCAKNLLAALFPYSSNTIGQFDNEKSETLFKEKRIASKFYFNRYFSFSVLEGEISDVAFEDFIGDLKNKSITQIVVSISEIICKSSADIFILKLKTFEDSIRWADFIKLAPAIAILSDTFPKVENFFSFGRDGARSQSIIFILSQLTKNSNKEESAELTKILLSEHIPIDFAFNLFQWIKSQKIDDKEYFDQSSISELSKVLRNKVLQECGETSLFEKYPDYSGSLLYYWKEDDLQGAKTYLSQIIFDNPKAIPSILYSITPIARSSDEPTSYKTNFTKNQYNLFTEIADKTVAHQTIRELYGPDLDKEPVQFFDFENKQTEINILRQFEHWYALDN